MDKFTAYNHLDGHLRRKNGKAWQKTFGTVARPLHLSMSRSVEVLRAAYESRNKKTRLLYFKAALSSSEARKP